MGKLLLPFWSIFSQSERIVEVGRSIWRSPGATCLFKRGQLEQVAQDHNQMVSEYLQQRRLHNLFGKPVPVLSHRALDTQVLFCKVAFHPGSHGDVLVPAVVPSQVQDSSFSLTELHGVPVGSFLQPVEVTLNGSMTLWCTSHFFHSCIITKTVEGTLCSIIQIIDEDVEEYCTQYPSLGYH